jgi:hypothetical protein
MEDYDGMRLQSADVHLQSLTLLYCAIPAEFGNYIGGDLDSEDEDAEEDQQNVGQAGPATGFGAPLEGYDDEMTGANGHDDDMMDTDGDAGTQVALPGTGTSMSSNVRKTSVHC